jgi:hypothetical protein
LLPGEPIKAQGFSVFRVGAGPWCTLYKPDNVTLNAGDAIVMDIDARLFRDGKPPAAGTLIDAGVFALIGGAAAGQVIADKSVWSFSPAGARTALLDAFDLFLAKAEGLEGAALRPGATEVLRRIVAQRVPATHPETLHLTHGLVSRDDTAQTYFDVQPGMRLRLDFSECQFVPPNLGATGLSGFVGGPTVTTDVISLTSPSGTPKIGVDAFLGAVRLPPIAQAQGGFGGVVDLAAALTAGTASGRGLRHVRICYPARSFPRADSGGNLASAFNVAVLGADDLAALGKGTAAYYQSGDAGSQFIGYFRGRAVIQPQIPVLIGGTQRRFVPLGTTVRQLLEWFAPIPRFPGFVDAPANLAFSRRCNGLSLGALYDTGACYAPLAVTDGGLDANGADALDFPVLAADVLTIPDGQPPHD